MMSQPQLDMIATRLRDRMLAQLGMRWNKAAAYIPAGSAKVHCAGALSEEDQALFDAYVLGFQDAIAEVVDMLDQGPGKPERPFALALAENSVFQDGSMPERVGPRHGHWRDKPARDRGVRRDPQARARAESLFRKGGDDDV